MYILYILAVFFIRNRLDKKLSLGFAKIKKASLGFAKN